MRACQVARLSRTAYYKPEIDWAARDAEVIRVTGDRCHRSVEPGGHVAFNLWYHHWEETAGTDDLGMYGWIPIAQEACREAGVALASPPPRPVPKKRSDLMNVARRHDFELLAELRDVDPSLVAYGIDFMAMDEAWPAPGRDSTQRAALLQRMHALAEGKAESTGSTCFLFRRTHPPVSSPA